MAYRVKSLGHKLHWEWAWRASQRCYRPLMFSIECKKIVALPTSRAGRV